MVLKCDCVGRADEEDSASLLLLLFDDGGRCRMPSGTELSPLERNVANPVELRTTSRNRLPCRAVEIPRGEYTALQGIHQSCHLLTTI